MEFDKRLKRRLAADTPAAVLDVLAALIPEVLSDMERESELDGESQDLRTKKVNVPLEFTVWANGRRGRVMVDAPRWAIRCQREVGGMLAADVNLDEPELPGLLPGKEASDDE